jgi:acyl carrier protein phosphodiesterase
MSEKIAKPSKRVRQSKASASKSLNPTHDSRREVSHSKDALRANAEKQKRFRESRKAAGAKQVLLWDFPLPADTQNTLKSQGYTRTIAWEKQGASRIGKKPPHDLVKVSTGIHEDSLHIARDNAKIGEALSGIPGYFINAVKGIPRDKWLAAYRDIQEFLLHFVDNDNKEQVT